MKRFTIIIVLIYHASLLFGQPLVTKSFVQISKKEFDKHQPIDKSIIKLPTIFKTKGVIKFKTPNKTITLKDSGEFAEYKCLGDIDNTTLTLVQKLEPNSEEYYFIDKRTAIIDTLIGEPVFAFNKKDIVCLQGSKTDIKQKIQVGQIRNGQYKNGAYFSLQENLYPSYIYWFEENTLVLKTAGNTIGN